MKNVLLSICVTDDGLSEFEICRDISSSSVLMWMINNGLGPVECAEDLEEQINSFVETWGDEEQEKVFLSQWELMKTEVKELVRERGIIACLSGVFYWDDEFGCTVGILVGEEIVAKR